MSNLQLLCSLSELWTSFKHSKWALLKLCPTKKMFGIKLSFHSRKKLLIWTKTPPLVIFQSQTLIVKTQYLWYQQWFRPRLGMVNELFSNFVQLRKRGDSSYLSNPKIRLWFEDFMQTRWTNFRERVRKWLNFECFLNFMHNFWMEYSNHKWRVKSENIVLTFDLLLSMGWDDY